MNQEPATQDSFTSQRSWADRNGFSHWALASMWIIAAFFLFQITAGIVSAVLLVIKYGDSFSAGNAVDKFFQNLDLVFIGNSAGQILFLGAATWFFTRLHTSGLSGRRDYLRLRSYNDTFSMTGITVILILVVQPFIWFLSWLNALIPVPEIMESMQNSQIEMIEQFLRGDHILLLTLFHVGVVPAVCEEILFRGYAMKSFEKSWGIWPAIIVSGLLFGAYHFQLSNLIPLATIGILLAYVTWISRSLYPAMIAHFVNNGGSVFVGTYYPESAFAEITPESMPPLWSVILSLAISSYLVYLMYQMHKANTGKADV